MLEEIKRKHTTFGDAQILKITFDDFIPDSRQRNATIQVHCMNKENDWKYEIINLIFTDILKFRFFHSEHIFRYLIFKAYLNQEDDRVIFNFFSEQENDEKEYEHSDFLIHSREISYEVVKTDS
jgi:hypothetical protein